MNKDQWRSFKTLQEFKLPEYCLAGFTLEAIEADSHFLIGLLVAYNLDGPASQRIQLFNPLSALPLAAH